MILPFSFVGLEAHAAGAGQGDANYDLELRGVAVPAYGSAGRVFGHNAFHQCLRRYSSELGGALTAREQVIRELLGGSGLARGEVIFHAVLHDAASGGVAVEIKVFEIQRANGLQQFGFLMFAEEIWLVEKAFREFGQEDGTAGRHVVLDAEIIGNG